MSAGDFFIHPRSIVHPPLFRVVFGCWERLQLSSKAKSGGGPEVSVPSPTSTSNCIVPGDNGRVESDFAEQTLLHSLPVNFLLETVHVELQGVIERFLAVVPLPIQDGNPDPCRGSRRCATLACSVLHHRHHSFSGEFRGDAANVRLSLLQVLQAHVNRAFSHHGLNL